MAFEAGSEPSIWSFVTEQHPKIRSPSDPTGRYAKVAFVFAN